jgi:hypothetical protein
MNDEPVGRQKIQKQKKEAEFESSSKSLRQIQSGPLALLPFVRFAQGVKRGLITPVANANC